MDGYEQSVTDLLRSTIRDAQDLLRGEIALAKAELQGEVARVAGAFAAMAAAAVAALIAVVFLLAAAAWAIPAAFAWPVWTGFAIVGAVVLGVAAVLAMTGRKRLNGGRHMPLTVDTMKENVQWTRARIS